MIWHDVVCCAESCYDMICYSMCCYSMSCYAISCYTGVCEKYIILRGTVCHARPRLCSSDCRPRDQADSSQRQQQSGGSHLSNTTCLTQVFFKSREEYDRLWRSSTRRSTHKTNEACIRQVALNKYCHTKWPCAPRWASSARGMSSICMRYTCTHI